MNNKYYVYSERELVTDAASNAEVQEKTSYWRTLFNDDQDWLNKSISIFTNDDVESIAKSSLSASIELNTSSSYDHDHWLNIKYLFFATYSESGFTTDNTIQNPLFFDTLLMRFAYVADLELASHKLALPASIKDKTLYHLKKTLLEIGYQTLILELNVLRVQEQLTGGSPEERYHSFNRLFLNDISYIHSFFDEYPVLLRLMCTKTAYWVQNVAELLHRLSNDAEQISQQFGVSGDIIDLDLGLGDSHDKGKMVAIITFANGRVVYKPRSHEVDIKFQQILSWVNLRQPPRKLATYTILNCGTYGWSNFVVYRECDQLEQLNDYYIRLGQILAILYSIDAVDFHHENIIACKDHPILIDLESIFHQSKQNEVSMDTAISKARYILTRSVNSTGILPFNSYYEKKDSNRVLDLSGLSGKEAQEAPFKAYQIKQSFRDDMHLAKDSFQIQEAQNVPKLNGEPVEILEYLNFIVDGFRQVYQLIQTNKTSYLALLTIFETCPVRTIIRPTAVYAQLLQRSYHPDFLRDAVDREVFLCRLEKFINEDTNYDVARSELLDLLNGDIPYFLSSPATTHLEAANQTFVAEYFEKAALTRVREKIDSLSDTDLGEQLHVIRMSILASFNAKHHKDTLILSKETGNISLEAVTVTDILNCSKRVGEYVLDQRITAEGSEDISWISTMIKGIDEVSWTISPVNLDFYNGVAGIGFYLSYLGKIFPEHNVFQEVTIRCVNTVIDSLNELQKQDMDWTPYMEVGGFTGISSYLYFLQHASVNLHRPEWFQAVLQFLPLLEELIEKDEQFDVTSGSAGALMVFLSLYEQQQEKELLVLAERCVQHLQRNATAMSTGIAWRDPYHQKFYTGFAHGSSGILAALAKFNKVMDAGSIKRTIHEGLLFERSMYVSKEKNWKSIGRDQLSVAWCHGAPGILLSRHILQESGYHDNDLESEIDAGLETTIKLGLDNNRSFCHGDFGQLEILSNFSSQSSDIQAVTSDLSGRLFEYYNKHGMTGGVSRGVEAVGLMLGWSGVGFGLLQQALPGNLPQILHLSPPVRS
ncbi:type 2 lantibiotic biosynthesis protein LanM [Paenibacillus sophorae]|uniref:Type 2 lantibiotic biosynthesis protein LanM n=1 Tax=Paenibacillus sophorae TaxID=1333845 RepID=A0A1H8ILC1_9BACL|nr:type 2 lanthipeptide synthetase LanM family protein [Paenibacillus sophorae]QWU16001.1 type 2 lantipeptide synthetase LanM family protein [Paenibacillus sophorae]SEN69231.1 type 2 lantibiotic biosynthesis protein LanM [Paenibacillus sophorae]